MNRPERPYHVAPTRSMLLVCSLLGLCLPLLMAGCQPDAVSPKESARSQVASEGTGSTPEQCERDIDNILDALQPDRYGISSDRDTTVNMMTTWLRQCGAAEDFEVSEADIALRAKLLTDASNEQASLDQFTDVDAGYLRNCLLLQQMVDSTLTDEKTDIERAVTLFYKVVRTVELARDVPGAIELGQFQAMLFGTGTSRSRAWIFAELMRQLRIDTVVIRPRGDEGDSARSLLLGVIIPEEGVYLFDCHLGLPLASPSDDPESPLPRMPATLTQARENDAIFRQYDVRGIDYPITAEKLTELEVLAVGTSSTWAPRFGKLQMALPVSVQVYDGLGTNLPEEPGLFERLENAGQDGLWESDDIRVWEYPDQTLSRLKSMTNEETQALQQLSITMQGPVQININPETGQPAGFELPKQNLQQGRIVYLQGDIETAKNVYLRSRLGIPHPQTPNQQTADWATYWAAMAQFEQGDYSVAAESTEHYLRRPGSRALAATMLRANALAHDGHFEEAVKVLEREPVRAPQYLGNQARVRRWRRLAQDESAVDPVLTAPPAEPKSSPADPETPAQTPEEPVDEPQVDSGTSDEETPAELDSPRETPDDLPASDEKPDPRFNDPSDADPQATDEESALDDAEASDAESSEEPPAESPSDQKGGNE